MIIKLERFSFKLHYVLLYCRGNTLYYVKLCNIYRKGTGAKSYFELLETLYGKENPCYLLELPKCFIT